MKNLIILTAVAALAYGLNQAEPLVVDQRLNEVPDDIADKMIADGVAKLADTPATDKPPKTAKKVKVRVLTECVHGKANDVVLVDADTAKEGKENGVLDPTPAAVAYAESLQKAAE